MQKMKEMQKMLNISFIVENVECHDIIKNLFDNSIVSSDTIINKFFKN